MSGLINPPARPEEGAYKRGFDAGVEYQKRADPPPMAKALKKELEQLRLAARAFMAAQQSDVVRVRTEARARLLAALGEQPTPTTTTKENP